MKWNWGTGIALFFSLFVLVILSLVYKSFHQSHDLVTPDYYAKEVAYQTVIDAKKNANHLNIALDPTPTKQGVRIHFPQVNTLDSAKGTIQLYRPDNAKLDKKLPLEDYVQGQDIVIPLSNFLKGHYKIILDWKRGETHYYWEDALNL